MRKGFGTLLPLLLLTPYICAYTPNRDNDDEYSIAIAGGHSSFADFHRDCSGGVISIDKYKYDDIAAQFAGRHDVLNFKLGAGRTSALQPIHTWDYNSHRGPILYAAPGVGLTTEPVGVDLGASPR